jgi:hypothetical protein
MLGLNWRHVSGVACASALILIMTAAFFAHAVVEPTVDELKARVQSANVGDRPRLCVQIAQKQLTETSKLYAATDDEKAQAALAEVVMYAELARDYALQSHKYQKQTEIAAREMARKLTEIKHTLGRDDQAPVQDAIKRMDRVRDDLLMAMFPKGAK